MTQEVMLKADPREGAGKGVARKLRAVGRVPAVLYGGEGGTVSLSVDSHEALRLFQSISVENTIVELVVEGEKDRVRTLVREVQTHPYRPEIFHIDFLRIQKGVALELDIPLHLEGVPDGVKLDGGILDQVIHTVHVKCIPSMIPTEFVLNIEGLGLNDLLKVSAIEVEEGVEMLTDPETLVASVSLPKAPTEDEEEEELEAGLEDAPEPELIGEDSDEDTGQEKE